ncbi:MAG: hypothetical protein R3F16_08425 [Myxococcota bacterium]
MNRALLLRRFGRGAARLAIGAPRRGPSLSELAREPIANEVGFSLAPSVACAIVLALLMLPIAARRETAATPVAFEPIEVRLWSEPALAATPMPTPTAAPARTAPRATDRSNHAMPAPESGSPALSPAPSAMPFEPTWIASASATTSTTDSDAAAERVDVLATSRPGPRPGSAGFGHGRPTLDWSPGPTDLLSTGAPATTPSASTGPGPRPQTASSTVHTIAAGPAWRASGERQAFLAALESGTGSATPPATPRPAVSARADTRGEVDLEWSGLSRAGWREVPLDDLPDCDPPGRQDLLKKRILLAAPFERECSDRDGSYRFVETRNLGAFLMWSRPNPDRPVTPSPDRDVCDVLERALRCLGGSSIEEPRRR